MKIDYKAGTPPEYRCEECRTAGCKLWRRYNTFVNHIKLLCVDCAEKDQKKRLTPESDAIGSWVPAVPTEEDDTYWGYTSIPQAEYGWWDRLPLRGRPGPKEWSPRAKLPR